MHNPSDDPISEEKVKAWKESNLGPKKKKWEHMEVNTVMEDMLWWPSSRPHLGSKREARKWLKKQWWMHPVVHLLKWAI